MFSFRRKEKHEFDNVDRELAKAKKSLQLEKIRRYQHEVRRLREIGRDEGSRNSRRPARELLQQIRDLDDLREYLTPEQEQQADQMGGVLPLILTLLQGQNRLPEVPQTETGLKEALKTQGKGQKKGGTTDLILAQIPQAMQRQIAAGRIPKEAAKRFAHGLADKEVDKIYKKLQSRRQK